MPKYHEISVTRFFCAHFREARRSTQRERTAHRLLMGQEADRKKSAGCWPV